MKFLSPTTISISGTTNVGKTVWLLRMLRENMFEIEPKRIIYFYGTWQDQFNDVKNIDFYHGLPETFDDFDSGGEHTVIVIDDLQDEVTKNKQVELLFTRGRHKKFTVIYLNQNLFYQGKHARSIACNTHYTILFRNPRAATQIKVLGSQTGLRHIYEAFEDATKSQYGYLVVDLHPQTDRLYSLITNVFPGEDMVVYH